MLIFVVPFLFIVCIGIPGIDFFATIKAWEDADEYDVALPLIEAGIAIGVLILLYFIS